MKKLKKIVAEVLLVAMVCALCACGAKEEPKESKSDSGNQGESVSADAGENGNEEPITLRFAWWGGDERTNATLEVIKKYEETHENVTIEAEYSGFDGYREKLVSQLSAGTAPDIVQLDPSWMQGFVRSGEGYWCDLTQYRDHIDLDSFGSAINSGIYDGTLVGLPSGLSGVAIIYNEEKAAEVGLEIPEKMSWEDLITVGKQVHDYNSDMYFLNYNPTMLVSVIMRPYLQQLTGKVLIDNNTKELGFTEEELLQLANYIKELTDNNVIPPAQDVVAFNSNLQENPKFINGDYVGILCYSSTCEAYAAAAEGYTFKASSLPMMENAKDDGYFCDCPQLISVYSGSKNVEAAVDFLDYFFNDPEAAAILKTVRSVPPTEVGQQVCTEQGILDGVSKDTVDVIKQYNGKVAFGYSTEEEVIAICSDMVMQIIYGEGTPEEIVHNTMPLFQNYVDALE